MQGRIGDHRRNLHTPTRSGNMYGISKNLVDDDDDWDREIFGDDISLKKVDISANKEGPYSNNLLGNFSLMIIRNNLNRS